MAPLRLIPNIAFIPKVERRASGVERAPSVSRHSTLDTRHSEKKCSGMTLIELGVVMGIVTVLLALVLGLSRHVNEIVKVRRAQTELGEWHETLNAWYLKYGVYPDPSAPQFNNDTVESNLVWLVSQTPSKSYYLPTISGNAFFSSLMSKRLATSDPWGTPYFYRSTTNAYELLSCGPNTQHRYELASGADATFPKGSTASVDPSSINTDDIYFEP